MFDIRRSEGYKLCSKCENLLIRESWYITVSSYQIIFGDKFQVDQTLNFIIYPNKRFIQNFL